MDGWMDVTKITEAHEKGLQQELDACLITVYFFSFGCCYSFFMCLCVFPVVLEKNEGLHQKPYRCVDSPVLFCHFFPFLSLETPTLNPLPLLNHSFLCEATSKLLVRHKVLFLSCLFIRLQVLEMERCLNDNEHCGSSSTCIC